MNTRVPQIIHIHETQLEPDRAHTYQATKQCYEIMGQAPSVDMLASMLKKMHAVPGSALMCTMQSRKP